MDRNKQRARLRRELAVAFRHAIGLAPKDVATAILDEFGAIGHELQCEALMPRYHGRAGSLLVTIDDLAITQMTEFTGGK